MTQNGPPILRLAQNERRGTFFRRIRREVAGAEFRSHLLCMIMRNGATWGAAGAAAPHVAPWHMIMHNKWLRNSGIRGHNRKADSAKLIGEVPADLGKSLQDLTLSPSLAEALYP